jgi:hypothetical protein
MTNQPGASAPSFKKENKMSNFQLEVNGLCNNGATVIAVYKELKEGVVLARWNWEYVTWVFPTTDQTNTVHGMYYRYKEEPETEEVAFKEAYDNFLERIMYIHGK